eukprot:SAG31_NODE_7_length_42755_cov_130.245728_12_plen_56_part_00
MYVDTDTGSAVPGYYLNLVRILHDHSQFLIPGCGYIQLCTYADLLNLVQLYLRLY